MFSTRDGIRMQRPTLQIKKFIIVQSQRVWTDSSLPTRAGNHNEKIIAFQIRTPITFLRPSFNYIEPNDDPKLSNLKEFARISGIKINFTRLFDGIRSTDDKCVLIRRILAQKGLQGEPTVAKCRQLKLDLQAKRESAELDKSVIIRAEGKFWDWTLSLV